MAVLIKGDKKAMIGDMRIGITKADLGATFANAATAFAAMGFDSEPYFAVMQNTNATGAGVRLYVQANGQTNYIALS